MTGNIVAKCVGCEEVRKIPMAEVNHGRLPPCKECFMPMVTVNKITFKHQPMPKKIKCKKCKGQDFYADDMHTWAIEVDVKNKEVNFTDEQSEIQGIFCSNCKTPVEIPDDYKHNYN